MATVYDSILRDPLSNAFLYDSAETHPGAAVNALVSNVAGLKTVRSAYDFSSAFFEPLSEPVAHPQVSNLINNPSGWYVIAKVEALTQSTVLYDLPIRCLTLHLTYQLDGLRGVRRTKVRVMPREDTESHTSATDAPAERIHMITPVHADVKINDQLVYDGWIYRVAEKLPENLDGHQYAYRLSVERFTKLDSAIDFSSGGALPGDGSYLLTNTTVTVSRRNPVTQAFDIIYPILRVRDPALDKYREPGSGQRGEGEEVDESLYVIPGFVILEGDLITTVSIDGHKDLNEVTRFVAGLADRTAAPLPLVHVPITGFYQ